MQEFHIADDHLRETLPPVIQAAFSIIPPLLGCHILIQNKLLGLYYTFLHQYCDEHNFPSPPPPMETVMADWAAVFRPVQAEVEAIPCIARGKAVHQPMRLGDDGQPRRASTAPPTPGARDTFKRSTTGLIPSANGGGQQLRVPSTSSIPSSSRDVSPEPSPRVPPSPGFGAAHLRATDFTTASVLGHQSAASPAASPHALRPVNSRDSARSGGADYFSSRRPSGQLPSSAAATTPTYSPVIAAGGGVVAKKKPPPPPPPKKIPAASRPPDEFVVALYTFDGQGDGDLSFREGDRIRIVKKTQTDQDWWVGEMNGVKGSFPANYCRAA